jgi:hypothetical protein
MPISSVQFAALTGWLFSFGQLRFRTIGNVAQPIADGTCHTRAAVHTASRHCLPMKEIVPTQPYTKNIRDAKLFGIRTCMRMRVSQIVYKKVVTMRHQQC